MDKYQKQVEQTLLDNEKEAFNELKKTYTNALKETKLMVKKLQADVEILEKANLENRSILQSKIYQLNYQKAMDEQLTAILKVVETENVSNTQSFLTKMYEDSFLGINYSLQQKGIPILMPINHKMIVDSVNRPTEKLNFKDRMYKNNKEFKKTVKAEISRGLALGKSYKEIAQQISLVTQVDLNKTYRIARTEGGRVSSEAKFESMQHAKNVGADLVKVWDSTLDHRTRELHAILDQQWEEIDEPFKVQGMEAMYPHGFGIAEMDINCRCVLLSVPRWDLEGEVTKYDNEHGYLVKTKYYDEWKKGYYTKIKELDIVEDVIAEAEERISGYSKVSKAVSDKVDKVLRKDKITINSFSKKRDGDDFELSGDVRDLYLTKGTRQKVDELCKQIRTTDDFEKYLKEKGIKLDVVSDTLKQRSSEEIEAVKKQIDYNIVAIEQYEELGGLSKLHTIHFFDPDLEVGGQYVYTAIGETKPNDDGHIYLRNNMSGFEVMHEYAHVWADSTKPKGEDVVTWSAILNENGGLEEDAKAYFGASTDVYEAEKFADAISRAFCYGKEKNVDFLANVSNEILWRKDEEKKK